MDFGDFTITKREIIFSIVIIAIMLTLGFIIHGSIDNAMMLKHQEYNTALRIENDADMFNYGMSTNVGNAYAHGTVSAVDTVSYPEVKGEYSYIKRVKEKYTQHTRIVTETYTDSKGNVKTRTRTETYWTWDHVKTWSEHSKKITFLGAEFDYGKIDLPGASHIDTQYETSHIRYVYSGAPTKADVVIYADLRNNTIDDVQQYFNVTIEEAHKRMTSKGSLVVFWIFWVLLSGGAVFGFVYIDNHWLEDRRNSRYEYICDRGYSRKQKSHSQFLQQSHKRDSTRTGGKLANLPRRLRRAVLVRLPRQKPKA